ncbi:MAG: tetratricopeptide repeat protein [Gammaproteobacteria bacterium]|nr:tetratricopeptide repeat protein [Gammaproteobacteria bacterium]MDE0651062.1 tetratricopeptide repeat protein [Gammaproteobacteria bacterium]
MDQSLERRIRRLYSCFHSSEDRQGRSFVPLADAYRRAGDLVRARLLLDEGLRRHPDFASAHVVAMRVARDVSDHAGALAATRRVLELDPGNVEARQVLARVGPLVEDAPASGSRVDGDAQLPDESWMAGDAGVWAAGTDSGLASVDPVALEAEEEQLAVAEPEEEQPVVAEPRQERAAPAIGKGAGSARPAGIPIETPAAASDAVADAGIYTRTMGRLYEQQGLQAQAIAVYEQLIESEPGDEALVSRLERLRRQIGAEVDATEEPEAVRGGETAETPDVVPLRGGDAEVVPIEALAPDAPMAGAREEAP